MKSLKFVSATAAAIALSVADVALGGAGYSLVAVRSGSGVQSLTAWSYPTAGLPATINNFNLATDSCAVGGAAFATDGSLLATYRLGSPSSKRGIRQFEEGSGDYLGMLVPLPSQDPNFREIAVSPLTGDIYVIRASPSPAQWDIERYDSTGAFQYTLASLGLVTSGARMRVAPDGTLCVNSLSGPNAGIIRRLDPLTGVTLAPLLDGVGGNGDFEFGPDGSLYSHNTSLALTKGIFRCPGGDWDAREFLVDQTTEFASGVNFTISPDQDIFASPLSSTIIKSYDGLTGASLGTFFSGSEAANIIDLFFGPAIVPEPAPIALILFASGVALRRRR